VSVEDYMNIEQEVLFTGGDGLLGGELKNIFNDGIFPPKAEFDVSNFKQMDEYISHRNIKTIFHAAAYTSPPKVDKNPYDAIETNIIGTCNIVKICMKYGARLIYVSTDYVFRGDTGNYKEEDPLYPVNKYAWSKLGGECAVRMYDKSVIIRTSFGTNEFPYDKAFVNQWTSREPVRAIAKKMLKIIHSDFCGVVHIGGDRKSVYEYAVNISPNKQIGKLYTNEVSFAVPKDTSLDVQRYETIFNKKG
jgi:dTDP-4-dehydrorhamnose reductase